MISCHANSMIILAKKSLKHTLTPLMLNCTYSLFLSFYLQHIPEKITVFHKIHAACNYFETETSFKFLINFGFLKALASCKLAGNMATSICCQSIVKCTR